MRIDWAMMFTIFLAIVLSELFVRGMFSGGSNSSTQVSAVTHSPAEATIVYANPIDEWIAEHHPNAQR